MSFIYDDKELLVRLIEAGNRSIQKKGQAQDPNMAVGDPSDEALPAGVTEDQIKREYETYKQQIAGQRQQVAEQNRRAEEFNRANPGKPQKMIQSVPVMVDYNNFRSSYIGRTSAQQRLDDPTAGITPQVVENYNLAKKLLLSLKDQVQPGSVKKEAPVDFGSETPPDIKPENLKTLGDFLTWSAANKVMWDGKRIAWDYNPGDPDAEPPIPPSGEKPDIEDPWVFQSYQKGRDRDQYTREAVTKTYYANKDGLLKFLTYLRDTPASKENKVFEVMIGKVINQVNQYLQPQEKIGPRPEDKPAAQFNDNDVVDGFPSNILDIKKAYEGIEQYAPGFVNVPQRLTYGDIKDFGSLQNWVSGMRDAAKPNEDPTSPEGNPCGIINILYLRAKYLASQVRYDRLRPKYSELSKVYLTNITNFGKQFTFNGQACSVTQPGVGPGGTQPGQEKPGQQGGQGGLGAASPQILQQLSSLRPFNAQYISFPEIKKFVDLYARYANDATVTQLASNINQYMDTAKTYYFGTDTLQLNNINNNRFKALLKNPSSGQGSAAQIAANLLYDIVVYGGQLYQRLVTSLQTVAQDPERGKYIDYRGMQQQVTPGGPQQTNVTTLEDLSQSLQREWMARR